MRKWKICFCCCHFNNDNKKLNEERRPYHSPSFGCLNRKSNKCSVRLTALPQHHTNCAATTAETVLFLPTTNEQQEKLIKPRRPTICLSSLCNCSARSRHSFLNSRQMH
uniref:Uncharacterized protein n=1 Tax=Rhipicephalus microplus TaxID=6941 RepID=A0A6G5AHE3_RHIMP